MNQGGRCYDETYPLIIIYSNIKGGFNNMRNQNAEIAANRVNAGNSVKITFKHYNFNGEKTPKQKYLAYAQFNGEKTKILIGSSINSYYYNIECILISKFLYYLNPVQWDLLRANGVKGGVYKVDNVIYGSGNLSQALSLLQQMGYCVRISNGTKDKFHTISIKKASV